MAEGLKQRILTAIGFGIPFLVLLLFNDITRVILLAILILLSAMEFLGLKHSKLFKTPVAIFSLSVSILILAVSVFFNQYYLFFLYAALISGVILLFNLFSGQKSLLDKGHGLFSMIYTTLPYTALVASRDAVDFKLVFFSMIILIWISDSSAYFVGKSVGKKKLMPSVSPGKTWEGFLGAGMITLICSYIFFSLNPQYSMTTWLFIGLAVWLFGSAGDLVESKFKRSINIKDSGSLLPGHGGILDRFDGFFFCIPFVLIIIEILN
ncbi:MAG: phosphatidate cytidylyltransferase [Bacteroidia bacterium]|nr:phosphatidate cytidylyltransferase [Bacteroidia bacterium]